MCSYNQGFRSGTAFSFQLHQRGRALASVYPARLAPRCLCHWKCLKAAPFVDGTLLWRRVFARFSHWCLGVASCGPLPSAGM